MTLKELRNNPAFPIHHLRALGALEWAKMKPAYKLLACVAGENLISTYRLVNAQGILLNPPGRFIAEVLARTEEDLLASGYEAKCWGSTQSIQEYIEGFGELTTKREQIAYARPIAVHREIAHVPWAYSIRGIDIPRCAACHAIFLKRRTIRPRFI